MALDEYVPETSVRPAPGRVSYPEVGEATRRVLQAAARAIPDRRTRVLCAVLALTATWSRLEESVCFVQLAEYTGIHDRRHLRRTLRALHDAGVIDYQPGRGRGQWGSVSLAKRGPIRSEKGADSVRKGGRFRSEKGARSGPPHEKLVPRSSPEKFTRGEILPVRLNRLSSVGWARDADQPSKTDRSITDPDEAQVYELLGAEGKSPEGIAEIIGACGGPSGVLSRLRAGGAS